MTLTGDRSGQSQLGEPPLRGFSRVAGIVVLVLAGVYAIVAVLATALTLAGAVLLSDDPVAYVDTDPFVWMSWPASLLGPGSALLSSDVGIDLTHCFLALAQAGVLACIGWALLRPGRRRRRAGVVGLVLVGIIGVVGVVTYVPRVSPTDENDPAVQLTEAHLAGVMEASDNFNDDADCTVRLVQQDGPISYVDSICSMDDGSEMSVPARITGYKVEFPSDFGGADDMDRLFPRPVQRALREVEWSP